MRALIVCPTEGGLIHYRTMAAIFNMRQILASSGIDSDLDMMAFTEIVTCRNRAATIVVESGYDFLVSIDDDVGIGPGAFQAMAEAGVPYIGACIPQRVMDFGKFADGVRQGFSDTDAQRYAAPLVNGPAAGQGVSQVKQVCTGFFILRRAPLQALLSRDAVAKKVEDTPFGDVDTYGFFDHIYDDAGARLSEDYSFCLRLHHADIPVHAYKGPGLSHSGEMTFSS